MFFRTRLLFAGGLLAAGAALALLPPAPGRAADLLYRLDTTCSLRGAAPVACSVEALDEGEATLYRHRIGKVTETIRISDSPIRMARLVEGSNKWQPLTTAAVRFSTNTVCFNGRDLCVVNPDYLNSVREENPYAMTDRDLARVHFGADGRVDISCFDAGCEGIRR